MNQHSTDDLIQAIEELATALRQHSEEVLWARINHALHYSESETDKLYSLIPQDSQTKGG